MKQSGSPPRTILVTLFAELDHLRERRSPHRENHSRCRPRTRRRTPCQAVPQPTCAINAPRCCAVCRQSCSTFRSVVARETAWRKASCSPCVKHFYLVASGLITSVPFSALFRCAALQSLRGHACDFYCRDSAFHKYHQKDIFRRGISTPESPV